MDSPSLATSHTNNRVHVNRAHGESLKSNDNRVIWWVLDTVEEGPLVQCTTARYYHKNTRPQTCHEPCGCWELWTNLRKINNNALSSWIRKQGGLGRSNCCRCGYASLKILKKINNNTCLSCLFLVRKPRNLWTSGYSWHGYVSLKCKTSTKLIELLNTMNRASVLQGKDPPPLVNDLNHIWNISWSWIIHLTVL